MLHVACSTLCFTQHPLDEALRRIAQLGFRYVDLGVQRWAHISAPELVHSSVEMAASLGWDLEQAGVELSAMNVGLERERRCVARCADRSRVCACRGP